MESPPESWYNPPDLHEVCVCWDCHNWNSHEEDMGYWIEQGCYICEEELLQEVE